MNSLLSLTTSQVSMSREGCSDISFQILPVSLINVSPKLLQWPHASDDIQNIPDTISSMNAERGMF